MLFLSRFPVRSTPVAALAAVALLTASAHADPPAPPAPPPADPPPAAAPPPSVVPVKHAMARAPRAPVEMLPDPELRARIVAPSAQGLWTLHLENEGQHPLRVPADARLLHFTIESGDTVAKRQPKPVKCTVPAALRPEGFPDRSALLLAPGDSYVETFDPRLFCFGKEAKAIVGGALVRARYGWEPAKGAKKVGPPFVVESTAFPAVVEPRKDLVLPPFVLSWLRPPEEESSGPQPSTAPEEGDDKDPPADEASAGAPGEPHPPAAPVDQNAARLELRASPYAEAGNGFKVSVSVTLSNVGHRPALAAVRSRMVSFRVEGPDGVLHCHAARPSFAMQRQGYVNLKPGGSTALTILVTEACGSDLFRRPGLYRIKPTLHLDESGAELGLSAVTGSIHALEPTVVRVAEGPLPFHKHHPHAIRAVPAGGPPGELERTAAPPVEVVPPGPSASEGDPPAAH